MPYISEKGQNDKNLNKKTIIFILMALVILFSIAMLFQNNRDRKLEHSRTVKAVLIAIKTPHGASIKFEINKKPIITELLNGDYSMLRIGDTMLIKYAIEDPELVEVVNKFYMKTQK